MVLPQSGELLKTNSRFALFHLTYPTPLRVADVKHWREVWIMNSK